MQPFEEYLQRHNLEALTIALNAKVRYMTVYNAMKGFPISSERTQQIRQAVFSMTKVPYAGPFVFPQPELVADTPTIPIKTIPRLNSYEKGRRL